MHEAWELYRKAVRFGTWDPAEIDLSRDRSHLAALNQEQRETILRFCCGFHEGEESVAVEFAPWITLIDGLERKLFMASQVFEEAKHTEFFIRYFAEVITPELGEVRVRDWVTGRTHHILTTALQETARRVNEAALRGDADERRRVAIEAITHYHGVIEGVLAMTAYQRIEQLLDHWGGVLPGLREGFRQIRTDEGRHVAFGMGYLREAIAADPGARALIKAAWHRLMPENLAEMYEDETYRQLAEGCTRDRWRDIGLVAAA